jgi:hypothetical protein
MFYSICEEDEWSSDHWDAQGHYTKDGECHSPANGVYLAYYIARRIFADIRVRYTDEGVKRFIQEECDRGKCQVDSDEIDVFCKAIQDAYDAETVEEFNETLWDFVHDSDFSEWNDIFCGNDLAYACKLEEPEGWVTH